MCGLFGVVRVDAGELTPDEIARARTARDRLIHRGPDQFGEWLEDNVYVGHRRLSILDTSENGRQPMVSDDGNVVLAANGEIYNFQRLRDEIGRRHFRSESDSEVLLHGYRKWGLAGLLDRLDGMYAFALFDKSKSEVILVRDRVGIKPMYVGQVGGYAVWASELKAIQEFSKPGELSIDETAAYDFITYRYIPSPKSLYKEVGKLEPGTYARICCRSGKVSVNRYWRLEPENRDVTDDEAAAEVYANLHESVIDQLISDVPVGFFLSGGIDSSTVVGMAARERSAISTFTIGFGSEANDESEFAEIVARRFDTNHTLHVLKEESVAEDLCGWMYRIFDEPFADMSAIATYRVAELARKDVTVVLSGDGGDELYGGYKWYRRFNRWKYGQLGLGRLRPDGWRLPFSRPPANVWQKIRNRAAIWSQFDALELYHSLMPGLLASEREPYRQQWEIPADYDDLWYFRRYYRPELGPWKSLQYLDFNTFLPDDILTKVDRVTMAVSLEARVPFLSHKLVEHAFTLPERFLYHSGDLKGGLKRSVRDLLPKEILQRGKKGFSIPTLAWRDSVVGRYGTFQETYTKKFLLKTHRIAYLSTSSLPSTPANSVHAMKMCSAFVRNGNQVLLFCRPGASDDDPFEYYGVEKNFDVEVAQAPVIPNIGGILQGILLARRLKKSGFEPDLIYGRHIYSLAMTARSGVPFIIELHNIHRRWVVRQVTLRLARRKNCLGIVVISDALRRDLLDIAPWLDKKIYVAPDAADDPVEHGVEIRGARANGELRVGYVGHLYEGKGMEVISALSERLPDVDFNVVGGTPEELAKWRARSGGKNIKFHGFVPHGQLSDRYADFDVCLLPMQSRVLGHGAKGRTGDIGRWTSPLKLFEYMSYGFAIVASDLPVLREVLTDGENALLVDPLDIDGWAKAIERLASDYDLRASLGRQAREDFLTDYTWSARASRVLEAFASG